uniref:NADH dehydrogenase subunit 6 n=1 Tax=Denticeps clupeoides TaxID=299321 RepID=A0AAY4BVJ4_9TELE
MLEQLKWPFILCVCVCVCVCVHVLHFPSLVCGYYFYNNKNSYYYYYYYYYGLRSFYFISFWALSWMFSLLFLCGCGLLGVGIWLSVSQGSFATFSPSFPSLSAANLVIGVGAIVMVTGFLGCLGSIKENKCLLLSVRSHSFPLTSPAPRDLDRMDVGRCHREPDVRALSRKL